jgi:hypothetical protein
MAVMVADFLLAVHGLTCNVREMFIGCEGDGRRCCWVGIEGGSS